MKIAIISDTHDHIVHTAKAIEQMNNLGVEAILHCGDLVSPFLLEEFELFNGPLHLVSGNNYGDPFLLSQKIQDSKGRFQMHGWIGRLEFNGVSIAFTHDPGVGNALFNSHEFHLVCFGHTHRRFMQEDKGRLLLNPGELLGRKEPPGWILLQIFEQQPEDETAPWQERFSIKHIALESM